MSDEPYFVFVRASGGHGTLNDELSTAIEFSNDNELYESCSLFKIPIDYFEKSSELYDPRVQILGYNCFVKKGPRYLFIEPCHNWKYTKDDDDYEACILIENLINENNLDKKIPIDYLKNRSCAITKEEYSDYFD